MTVRTEHVSNGVVIHWYRCAECKTEDKAAAYGANISDDAINSVPPHGWLRTTERDTRGRPIAVDYCRRCAVSPEYRKGG